MPVVAVVKMEVSHIKFHQTPSKMLVSGGSLDRRGSVVLTFVSLLSSRRPNLRRRKLQTIKSTYASAVTTGTTGTTGTTTCSHQKSNRRLYRASLVSPSSSTERTRVPFRTHEILDQRLRTKRPSSKRRFGVLHVSSIRSSIAVFER